MGPSGEPIETPSVCMHIFPWVGRRRELTRCRFGVVFRIVAFMAGVGIEGWMEMTLCSLIGGGWNVMFA